MGARFVSVDRETPMLLRPDLRDWGPEDDRVPFVFEAVDRLRLESFVEVLELAHEQKLLKLGKVSLEGAHLKANASIDRNVSYKRAVEIREQLI
jgi:hypothetical protein